MEETQSPAFADYRAATRRYWWLVALGALLGALPGLLGLLHGLSDNWRVEIEIPRPMVSLPQDADKAIGIREPSVDAIILGRDLDALAPDFKNDDIAVRGEDDIGRIVISSVASSADVARANAMAVAEAFVERSRAAIESSVALQVDYSSQLIADANSQLDAIDPDAAGADTQRVALLQQRLSQQERLSAFTTLIDPRTVYGDPVDFGEPERTSPTGSIVLIVIGGLFGALIGAAIAVGLGVFDGKVRSLSRLEAVVRGAPVIAVLPRRTDGVRAEVRGAARLAHDLSVTGARTVAIVPVSQASSSSLIADALRNGLLSLGHAATIIPAALAPGEDLAAFRSRVMAAGESAEGLVLIDVAAPVASGDEAFAIAGVVDAVVLASTSGVTTDAELAAGATNLVATGARVIGQTLDGVPQRELTWASLGSANSEAAIP